ncbi:MAG: hypothetical protein IT381_20815 [Deltaproteobacteria bacterium]|nr:hypothetical protein [Deltaproteobacteria bacterium]
MRLIMMLLVLFSARAALAAEAKVKVLSATIKDKAIGGAQLTFQTSGQSSVKATTADDGTATLTAAPFGGADDGNVNLIIEKQGFSALVVKCPCLGMTYALSENMTRAEGIRVVLNWGNAPRDLDSHLAYGENHIFFQQKKGEQANLDVDDTDGFGPETVTVDGWVPEKDYVYAVHNYSQASDVGKKSFSGSKAKVFVYKRNILQRVYEVNPEGVGNLWVIFRVDKLGTINDINQYADVSDTTKVGKFVLGKQWNTGASGADGVVSTFSDLVLKKGPALVELGWSQKGRFGFVTFDYKGGTPCVTVGVQDMITDARMLEEKQCGPNAAGKTPASVDDWRLVDGIEQKLQGLNLQPVSRPLYRFPHAKDGDTLDVKVNGDELIASSAKKGSKSLGKLSAIDAKAAQKDVGIEGFFQSPFEPRVAVLYAVPVAKEGGYDYIVKVSGFHLKVGFKK